MKQSKTEKRKLRERLNRILKIGDSGPFISSCLEDLEPTDCGRVTQKTSTLEDYDNE